MSLAILMDTVECKAAGERHKQARWVYEPSPAVPFGSHLDILGSPSARFSSHAVKELSKPSEEPNEAADSSEASSAERTQDFAVAAVAASRPVDPRFCLPVAVAVRPAILGSVAVEAE